MRFDDTLDTVLANDLATPGSVQAAWRQIVDLIGRGRAPANHDTLAMLERIRPGVPAAVRTASARALTGARPPVALIRLFANDEVAVAAPVLRDAPLPADDWIALLPTLAPSARAILRHRHDLPLAVIVALESFGTVDLVAGADTAAGTAEEPEAPATTSAETIADGLSPLADALRCGNGNEGPLGEAHTFRIADVVARLKEFQRRHEQAPSPTSAPPPPPTPTPTSPPEPPERMAIDCFRFETDPAGVIRRVEGIARGALVGMGLARQARPAEPGVDGIASGAFRRRARFTDARLSIGGGPARDTWLISAIPLFDSTSGRFSGYRGSGRRPRHHECAGPATVPAATSDSLRQLVHELRTPAGAIAGFAEMIEHQLLGPVAAAHRAQAARMRDDAGSLMAAIEDLDAAARIDTGAFALRPEPVDLTALIARIAGELAPLTASRGAAVALPDAAGVALADVRALERLVMRTLGAMIAAADAGETITIRAFDGAESRIGLAMKRPAALDTHPGEAVLAIDDEDSPVSLLGTGFALRLSRNLARELGGALVIGQRHVTLYLPAAADHAGYRTRTN